MIALAEIPQWKFWLRRGCTFTFLFFFWTFSALDYTRIAVSGCCQWDEETVTELLVLWKLLDRSTYQIHKKVCSDSHLFSLQHCSRPWTETWPSSLLGASVLSFPVSFWSPKACVLCLNVFPPLSVFPSFFWLSRLVPIAPDYPQLFSAFLLSFFVFPPFVRLTCVPLVNQPPVHLSPCLLFSRVKLAAMCLTSTAPHLWFPVSSYLLYFLWA